ncbi:hypothetical protein [Erwinia sp. Leaf53]|uniref:hypothetical protein n=1 Tax=Erwinia sp. Leaf53 TaxID=1736225 RepID=UPI0006FAFAFF|nr:hypothetical protein [Erwinia sp. Leaf53]KQN56755.1 hypothetical protein ASF13_06440 [Erwinia sp. Leaf53]
MKDIDLNKLKDLAIKAAAGSFPVPHAFEEDRNYCEAEINYLSFAEAVTPAAFLAIVNDLQAEVAAKQQNVDYLADRIPETQHNGMMQLSHQLEEAQALLRHTQDKLGKALLRNSEQAVQLARRDAATGEPIGYIDPDCLKEYRGVKSGGSWSATPKTGEYNQTLPIYLAAQPAALPPECSLDGLDHQSKDSEDIRNLAECVGWNACRDAAKALGCQPIPVVKLPARFKPKVSSLLGNHAAVMASNSDGGWVNLKGVIEALDASGIKWEVEHETSD